MPEDKPNISLNWCSLTYNMGGFGFDKDKPGRAKAVNHLLDEAGVKSENAPDVISFKVQEGKIPSEIIKAMKEKGYSCVSNEARSLAGGKLSQVLRGKSTHVSNYLFVKEPYEFKPSKKSEVTTKLGKGIYTIEGTITSNDDPNVSLKVRSSNMHLESKKFKTRNKNENKFIAKHHASPSKDPLEIFSQDLEEAKTFNELGGDGNKRLLMMADTVGADGKALGEDVGTRIDQDSMSPLKFAGYDVDRKLENSDTTYEKEGRDYYEISPEKKRHNEQTGGNIDKLATKYGGDVKVTEDRVVALTSEFGGKEPSDHKARMARYEVSLDEKPDHQLVIAEYKKQIPDLTSDIAKLKTALEIVEGTREFKEADQFKFREDTSSRIQVLQNLAGTKGQDTNELRIALLEKIARKEQMQEHLVEISEKMDDLHEQSNLDIGKIAELVEMNQFCKKYNQCRRLDFEHSVQNQVKDNLGPERVDHTTEFENNYLANLEVKSKKESIWETEQSFSEVSTSDDDMSIDSILEKSRHEDHPMYSEIEDEFTTPVNSETPAPELPVRTFTSARPLTLFFNEKSTSKLNISESIKTKSNESHTLSYKEKLEQQAEANSQDLAKQAEIKAEQVKAEEVKQAAKVQLEKLKQEKAAKTHELEKKQKGILDKQTKAVSTFFLSDLFSTEVLAKRLSVVQMVEHKNPIIKMFKNMGSKIWPFSRIAKRKTKKIAQQQAEAFLNFAKKVIQNQSAEPEQKLLILRGYIYDKFPENSKEDKENKYNRSVRLNFNQIVNDLIEQERAVKKLSGEYAYKIVKVKNKRGFGESKKTVILESGENICQNCYAEYNSKSTDYFKSNANDALKRDLFNLLKQKITLDIEDPELYIKNYAYKDGEQAFEVAALLFLNQKGHMPDKQELEALSTKAHLSKEQSSVLKQKFEALNKTITKKS